ncbi:MAG: LLM class flavin-dependent oxidoreductase, partial [Dehalococcoidia bacterium]
DVLGICEVENEPVLKRLARIGDGWIPLDRPNEETKAAVERVRSYAREAGRDPSSIAMAPVMHLANSNFGELLDEAKEWRGIRVTHLYLDTMNSGLATPKDHIQTITEFKKTLDELG